MLGSDTAQRVRKGTKSCAECRRRKVRCTRVPEHATVCRRCEERGSACVEQISGTHEHQTHRLPSRYRISQLESKVASLNKAVRNIESQLGHQHIQTPDRTTDHFSASNISDDDSTVSDVVPGNQPSQLRSLFQNDWLSIDTGRDERSGKTRAKSKTHILDAAREALQKLIPSKDEISNVAKSATTWLSLLHTLLPQSFVIKSGTEMLQVYDDMQDSHVDTLALASWMLIVALTAQQVPYVRDRSETLPSNYQNLLDFSRAVSETVESKLLLHDKLISTTEGLAVAMDFFRLQMIQGNFQKAWLRLRHNIAIAELMGLPKSFQAVQLEKTNGSAPSETLFYRAQMWEVLYTADRISAMVMNLPPATSRYQQAKTQSLISNGVVQPQAYLNRLTYIAVNVPYSTGTTTALKSDRELHTTAMTLAKELSLLASEVPKSWWNGAAEKFKPDQMVQFLHYCVAMRVHLPFAITEDTGDDNSYSRKACIDACQSVARRYVSLRRKLPPGIFLSRVLDLQVFTASVVLLLTSHSSSSTIIKSSLDRRECDKLITDVFELLEERSHDIVGSDIARSGVSTLRSLHELFEQDANLTQAQQLSLNVPLLGKVQIRRNHRTKQNLPAQQAISSRSQVEMPLWPPNGQPAYNRQGHDPFIADTQTSLGIRTQDEQNLDAFFWSVENDYEDFFQETLMTDNFAQFPIWENIQ